MPNDSTHLPTLFATIAAAVADSGDDLNHALLFDARRNQKMLVLVATTDLATEAILSYIQALESEGIIGLTGTQDLVDLGGIN